MKKNIIENDDVEEADVKLKSTNNYLRNIFSIKKEMLPLKVMYFFWGGLVAIFQPYLNAFFVCAGLSALKAGTATAFLFIPSLVVGPLWGVIADYTGRRYLILLILCIGSALSIGSLPFLSKMVAVPLSNVTLADDIVNKSYSSLENRHVITTTTRPNYVCNGSITDKLDCLYPSAVIESNYSDIAIETSKSYAAYPGWESIDDADSSKKGGRENCPRVTQDSASTLFYTFLIATAVSSMFVIVIPFYMESIAMPLILTYPKEVSYGGQRIFGSVGCTLAFYFAGFIAQKIQFDGMPNYSVVFFLYIPFVVIMIPMGVYIIRQSSSDSKEKMIDTLSVKERTQSERSSAFDILFKIISTCTRFDVFFYLLSVMICGIAFNLFIYLTVLLVEHKMAISKTEMGMIFAVNSISESIFFLLSSKIKEVVGSTFPTMAIGLLFYFIRYIVMSFTEDYSVMLSIQILGGASFSVSWAAALEHVDKISPEPIKVSMFLIVQTIHFGICALIVNIGGMNLYDIYGAASVFKGFAIVCGVWSVLMLVYHGYTYSTRMNNQSNESLDESLLDKTDLGIIDFDQSDFDNSKSSVL